MRGFAAPARIVTNASQTQHTCLMIHKSSYRIYLKGLRRGSELPFPDSTESVRVTCTERKEHQEPALQSVSTHCSQSSPLKNALDQNQ